MIPAWKSPTLHRNTGKTSAKSGKVPRNCSSPPKSIKELAHPDGRSFRIVGIRSDGSRSLMVKGLSITAADAALTELLEGNVFTGMLVEREDESGGP